jgi:3-phenylpropionate/trans-cinnamate dioxygenase ferredoxin subunit
MYNYVKMKPSECEFIPIIGLEDIPVGERLFIEIDQKPMVVFNIGGEFYCIADVCSHDDGPVGEGELEDYDVICPRHGARFDVRDGKVISLPAVVDIPAYPVRVKVGMIEIGLPLET